MLDSLLHAARPWLAPVFTLWGSPVSGLEMVAFALSLAMVGCNLRVNPLGWPLAIASSLLYGLLFADGKLYGQAGLQLFFVAIAVWGWWQWRRGHGGQGGHGQRLRVHTLSPRRRWQAAAATLAAWPLLAMLLRTTDSDVPWLDALPTVASITGQMMLARKLVENWPVWVAVNVVSVGLFASQGLWLTVLLYAIFAGLSLVGWRSWQRRVIAADD